jgi:hypothetical protein
MNRKIKLALAGGLALAGLGFAAATASAAPMQGLDPGIAHQSDALQGVQNVRYICGYWGCRWVPGPYWGPGPYWHRHWGGWGGGWHRWHRHW